MPSKRSSFLFAGLMAAAAFATIAGAATTVEPGTDRLGSDYKGFALGQPDPQLCRQACDADASCKAYTYVKPGVQAPQAMCYLKNKVPPPTLSDCCTSGVRTGIPIKIIIPTPMPLPQVSSLRTLVPGPGTMPKAPAVAVPGDLAPAKRMQLTGGKDGDTFAHLAPNHMRDGTKGLVYFIGPNGVWGGSGSASEPILADFPASSDERVGEVRMKLTPGKPQLLLVDCKVSNTHDNVVYLVSELAGPEQLFKDEQLVDDHLLFLVNSGGVSFVTISADHPWNFYSCEIRAL